MHGNRGRRKELRRISPQGEGLGIAFGVAGATFIGNSFYGPGQRSGAEWPRAEIRLRGGLLQDQVLGVGSQVLGRRDQVTGHG